MPTVHRSNPNRYFNPEDEVEDATSLSGLGKLFHDGRE
jgi:hypothetical protein